MSDIEEHNSEQRKRRSEIEETDSAISIEEVLSLITSRLRKTRSMTRGCICDKNWKKESQNCGKT